MTRHRHVHGAVRHPIRSYSSSHPNSSGPSLRRRYILPSRQMAATHLAGLGVITRCRVSPNVWMRRPCDSRRCRSSPVEDSGIGHERVVIEGSRIVESNPLLPTGGQHSEKLQNNRLYRRNGQRRWDRRRAAQRRRLRQHATRATAISSPCCRKAGRQSRSLGKRDRGQREA